MKHYFFRIPAHRHSSERASVFAEAAIALPVMFLFLYGVIQYGLILSTRIALEHAASVVARVALVNPTADFDTVAQDALNSSLAVGQLNLPISTSTVTVDGAPATRFDIEYRMPILLGFIVPNLEDGELVLRASSTTPAL